MRKKSYAAQELPLEAYVEGLLAQTTDADLAFVLRHAQQRGTPPLQMIAADARHLEVLARTLQPKKIVEIGTLCGYSAVCLARGLAPGGVLYTLERSTHHAQVAGEVFQQLGLQDRVVLVFGDAHQTLPTLASQGPFDMVFIDADKEGYPFYLDWAVANLRKGGLLVADNVFVFGHITTPQPTSGKLADLVHAMRAFNQACVSHKDLVTTFLPTGEGLLVAVKV